MTQIYIKTSAKIKRTFVPDRQFKEAPLSTIFHHNFRIIVFTHP